MAIDEGYSIQVEPKTTITIKIYEPIPEDKDTHKPQVIFEGDIISMKEMSMIEFELHRALRHYKILLGKDRKRELKEEKENSDD